VLRGCAEWAGTIEEVEIVGSRRIRSISFAAVVVPGHNLDGLIADLLSEAVAPRLSTRMVVG